MGSLRDFHERAMNDTSSWRPGAFRFAGASLTLVLLAACSGAEPAPELPEEPVDQAPQAITTDKVDLLLVVDGSMSMADKQAILAPSVQRLLRDLIAPSCVDDTTGLPLADADQPLTDEACPEGSARPSEPVRDLRSA
jgi:hypothetical protein